MSVTAELLLTPYLLCIQTDWDKSHLEGAMKLARNPYLNGDSNGIPYGLLESRRDMFYVDSEFKSKLFWRIVHETSSQHMVHSFVRKDNGDVIKSAGWKRPAKRSNGDYQTRFNLFNLTEWWTEIDWAGRYLYAR